jgi:hypothetical protein
MHNSLTLLSPFSVFFFPALFPFFITLTHPSYPRAKWEDSTIVLDDQGLKLKKPYTMEDAVYAALNDTGKVFFLDSLKKARGASGLEAQ